LIENGLDVRREHDVLLEHECPSPYLLPDAHVTHEAPYHVAITDLHVLLAPRADEVLGVEWQRVILAAVGAGDVDRGRGQGEARGDVGADEKVRGLVQYDEMGERG
jgi:hypothetical protein